MDDITFEEQYGFTKEAAIAHFGLEEGETLAHFGVKGMKWGKRKARGSRPASSGRPRMGNRSVNPGATKSGDGKSEKAPMSRKKKIAIGVGIWCWCSSTDRWWYLCRSRTQQEWWYQPFRHQESFDVCGQCKQVVYERFRNQGKEPGNFGVYAC